MNLEKNYVILQLNTYFILHVFDSHKNIFMFLILARILLFMEDDKVITL